MKTAYQMDHIAGIDLAGDSTFRIALEAQKRGHELFHYLPGDIWYESGRIMARGNWMTLDQSIGNHFTFSDTEEVDLAEMDVVWLRQDPPFDMGYITTTHLLDMLPPQTLVCNNPFWVRNHPEKLVVLNYPELMPPTVIARNRQVIDRFRSTCGDIIIKPLYGNGGAGIFRVGSGDRNYNSLIEMFMEMDNLPLIAQQYLPDVREGDKRILLVNGEPVGAINRVPPESDIRANLHVGGRAEAVDLNERDMEICRTIKSLLRDNGLLFTGIDVIGSYLTEINVTSPTGIVELERFNGTNAARMIWEHLEQSHEHNRMQ